MVTHLHRRFFVAAAFIALWVISLVPPGYADLGWVIPGAPVFNNPVYCVATQADGRILVAGNFDTVNGVTRNHIARFSADMSVMEAFDPNVSSTILTVAVQTDGKILIGGYFSTVGGVTRNRLARLNADGTLDTSFINTNLNQVPRVIAIQDDGKIIVGGDFTTVDGVSQPYLARLDSSGALDTSYTPVLNSSVRTASIQTNGDLLLSGHFTTINSTTRNRMARLDSSGTLDASFDPNLNGPAESIAVRPDGKILIGKGFTSVASSSVPGVALLNGSTGALDSITFSYTYLSAGEIALQANGKFLLNRGTTIARFNADGSPDYGYPTLGVGPANSIDGMMISNDRLSIGGAFISPGLPADHFVQYEHDSSTSTLTVPTSTSARWMRGGNIKEVQQVVFQHSADGGSTWSDLSYATRIPGGWEITGVTIPTTGHLRANGRTDNSGPGTPSLNSATVTLTPTLRVHAGNFLWINDGDTTPRELDLTSFGSVDYMGGTKVHTLKLYNPSALSLTVSAINITGTHAADFATSGISLPVVIPGFGETSFSLTFQPSASGTRTATVEITSTDPVATPYDFAVQGTGIAPDPELRFSGIAIIDGDASPTTGKGTLFADTQVINGATTQTFTLANTGSDPLRVTNILTEGGQAGDFDVTPIGFTLPFDLPAGDTRNFQVTFNPADVGSHFTTLKIRSNDGTKAVYDVALGGVGVTPQMQVTGLGVNVDDNGYSPSPLNGTHFGDVVMGTSLDRVFTVQNTGSVTLEILDTKVEDLNASEFAIIGSTTASLAPGATANFTVRFTPQMATDRYTKVYFTTNRSPDYLYDFPIRGFGRLAEINVRGNNYHIWDGQTTLSTLVNTQFGKRATISDSVTHVFTVENSGNMDLNITSMTLDSGTHFTLDASAVPATLAAGTNATFTITYSPTSAGTHTDTVRILSDDADEANFDYAIGGTGVVSGGAVAFNPGPNGHIYSTAAQPDGKHLVGGLHATIGGSSTQARISRLLAGTTHSMDSGFVPPVLASGDNVHCSAVLPDGKILIGGAFTFSASGKNWNRLVRLNADGTLDTTFVVPATGTPPNPSAQVNAIAIQKDGRIIIAGNFTTVSGGSRTRIARLNADSSLDTTFVSPNPNAEVWSIALTDVEQIIAAGAFTNLGGSKDYMAMLDFNGGVLSGFTTDANAVVNSVAVQADRSIVMGGNFTTVNGTPRARLARVSGFGIVDAGFNPNITTTAGNVFTSVIQADGKIIAGGAFTTPYNRIARFNSSGTADSSFNPNVSSASATVFGLAMHKDGTVLAGGSFTTINGQSRTNLALLENGSTSETMNVTNNATRVEWLRSGTTPETTQVIFERWTGSTWVPLVGATGAGTRIGTTSGWEITGVRLPQYATSTIRARARIHGGRGNGSSGIATSQISYYSSFTPGPQPDIAVQTPLSVTVADGGSAENFGTVYFAAGATVAPRTKVYVIRNTGNATLNGLSIPPLTGPHAADYTVSPLSTDYLIPNATATFTVAFQPSAAGTRTAALQIDSNVTGTRNPFNIALTGSTSNSTFDVVYTTGTEVGISATTFTGAGKTINVGLDRVPQPGASLSVLDITGISFITAPFTNIAHGDTVTLTYNGVNYDYVADYYGGTGNDFELVWKHGRHAAWGGNSNAQYGDGSTTSRGLPWPVNLTGPLAGKTILRLAVGTAHTLAVCSDGSVLAWGDNDYGQLGDNTTISRSTPVEVNTTNGVSALYNKKVVAVAAGTWHSLALCSDGTLVAWGYNGHGRLGDNTTTQRHAPVLVNRTNGVSALYAKTVVSIDAGSDFSIALCSDGILASWGFNFEGELGINSIVSKSVPTLVDRTTGSALAAKTVVAVSAGDSHTLAVRSDGTLVSWGDNGYKQLGGEPTTIYRTRPILVDATSSSSLYQKKVTAISAGAYHSLALCEDGTIASWGYNANGQLGTGSTATAIISLPTTVSTAAGLSALHNKEVVDIAAYEDFSVALCTDGTAASWGQDGTSGALGTNNLNYADSAYPVSVSRAALSSDEYFVGLPKGGVNFFGVIQTRGVPSATLVLTSPSHNGVVEGQAYIPVICDISLVNTGSEVLDIDYWTFPLAIGQSHYFSPMPAENDIAPGEIIPIEVTPNLAFPVSYPCLLEIHHNYGIYSVELTR